MKKENEMKWKWKKKKNTKNNLKNVARLNKNVGNTKTANGMITVLSINWNEFAPQSDTKYPNPKPWFAFNTIIGIKGSPQTKIGYIIGAIV